MEENFSSSPKASQKKRRENKNFFIQNELVELITLQSNNKLLSFYLPTNSRSIKGIKKSFHLISFVFLHFVAKQNFFSCCWEPKSKVFNEPTQISQFFLFLNFIFQVLSFYTSTIINKGSFMNDAWQ